MKLSEKAKSLWAKKNRDPTRKEWLPLYVHLRDTAEVCEYIFDSWLSEGSRKLLDGSCGGEARKLVRFVGASHDLGKASAIFQAKVFSSSPSETDRYILAGLERSGLTVNPYREYPNASLTPHAVASYHLLADYVRRRFGEKSATEKKVRKLASVVAAHHGKPPDLAGEFRNNLIYESNYFTESAYRQTWTEVQDEIVEYSVFLSGYDDISDLPDLSEATQVILAGIAIMADWIASNDHFFPYMPATANAEEIDWEFRSEDGWKALEFPESWRVSDAWAQPGFFGRRFGEGNRPYTPNPLQEKTIGVVRDLTRPGIVVIESTMGSGKTEAALAACEIMAAKTGRNGVFFALPTQATTNSMFPRMLDWMERIDDRPHSVRLAHGKAQYNKAWRDLPAFTGSREIYDNDGDTTRIGVVHEWFEGSKKSMLADFVVGTIDQLLFSGLKQKHVMLRHLGLSGKVVIIDEAHSYDAHMNEFLETALRWLSVYGVPVIVLSATLPSETRYRLMEVYQNPHRRMSSKRRIEFPSWATSLSYPVITASDGEEIVQESVRLEEESKTIRILCISDDKFFLSQKEIALQGEGCIGIILNTVKRAQEFYEKLKEIFGSDVVALFHSRFLTEDRVVKEEILVEELGKPKPGRRRPKFRIVVGTQVLEQSLDIDFDLLITDLCPVDLLLQRIGRLFRHLRLRPKAFCEPRCIVLTPDDGSFERGSSAVYGDYLLYRTRLAVGEEVVLPDDIASLVQCVYTESAMEVPLTEEYKKMKVKWENEIKEKQRKAKNFCLDRPSRPMKKSDAEENGEAFDSRDLINWLKNTGTGKGISEEKIAEISVRDTDPSVEVLVVYTVGKKIRTLPWCSDQLTLSGDEIPSREEAMILARQSVRLPGALTAYGRVAAVIEELEGKKEQCMPRWKQNPLLRYELFLVLNEEFTGVLGEVPLRYDKELGLVYGERRNVDGETA